MNQVAIKIAAEEFMQALLDWKSERTIRETIAPYRPEWGEQEILNCIERSESLINPISVHDKFHRTLILSGFCFLKIAKISLNSSFFPKPIKC